MGRPKKINFTFERTDESNLCFEVAVEQIFTDPVDVGYNFYTLYTDLCFFQLPAMTNVIKQLSKKLYCAEKQLFIKSISF